MTYVPPVPAVGIVAAFWYWRTLIRPCSPAGPATPEARRCLSLPTVFLQSHNAIRAADGVGAAVLASSAIWKVTVSPAPSRRVVVPDKMAVRAAEKLRTYEPPMMVAVFGTTTPLRNTLARRYSTALALPVVAALI